MLHGLTGSGEDWQHVFAHPLAGYRAIAPDLRGHGSSTNRGVNLGLPTLQPSRIDALIHVSGTPRFPDQARAIMKSLTEESRSTAEWAEMRGRHHNGDDQIRALAPRTRV